MQQADRADTTLRSNSLSEIPGIISGEAHGGAMSRRLTRRLMLTGVAAASAAAAMPALAAPTWSAKDWITRWHRLGCGLGVSGNALHLKSRLNGDRAEIGVLIAEVAPAERQTAVIAALEADFAWKRDAKDLAIVAVRRIEQVDREYVFSDEDPIGHKAWIARADSEARRLLWTSASTHKGLAAKLRHGVSMHSEIGDQIVERALQQLERMA